MNVIWRKGKGLCSIIYKKYCLQRSKSIWISQEQKTCISTFEENNFPTLWLTQFCGDKKEKWATNLCATILITTPHSLYNSYSNPTQLVLFVSKQGENPILARLSFQNHTQERAMNTTQVIRRTIVPNMPTPVPYKQYF